MKYKAKIKGFNPRNNDWEMVEYMRASPAARFSRVASGAVWYSCHVGARTNDFVFTRG